MPRVSVIITTHSRPGFLPRAIESARLAGTDAEIVVVDDASADETSEFCRRTGGIRYVRLERNQRVAGARNVGILASSGEYITLLDDDDVRLPGSLDLQTAILDSEPEVGLVYGQAFAGDENCATISAPFPSLCPRGDIFWRLLERNFIPCLTAVFRRSCLYRVGLLDEAIPGVDDWDLWIRIAEMYEVGATQQPVAVWRKSTATSGQGSSETVDLIALSRELLRSKWLALPRAAAGAERQRRDATRHFSLNVCEHLLWQATSAVVSGELGAARTAFLTLLRLHPSSLGELVRKWSHLTTLRLLLGGAWARDEMSVIKARLKESQVRGGSEERLAIGNNLRRL